jgi:glutathione peroxidase
VPRWNFNKVLIGADGDIVATWGSMTKPEAPKITHQIEAELAR